MWGWKGKGRKFSAPLLRKVASQWNGRKGVKGTATRDAGEKKKQSRKVSY